MTKGAKLSDDRKYRYQLWRIWDDTLPKVAFVGLNPSYADEEINDPTINRCIDFTKKWGYGGFYMINLFAFISTDPNGLSNTSDPVGSENDKNIGEVVSIVDKVICAWGNNGILNNRNSQVLSLINEPFCLKINAGGQPAHPLYLKGDLQPIFFAKTSIPNNRIEPLEQYDENPFLQPSTKPSNKKSEYVFVQTKIDRTQFQNHHWLKHFKPEENLLYRININDGEIIFNQSDEIIIGNDTVYWYISRVGNFYTKSNGEFDAEHIGETFNFKRSDVKHWKTICIQTTLFFEAEMKNGDTYHSIGIPLSEIDHINELQKVLNQLV